MRSHGSAFSVFVLAFLLLLGCGGGGSSPGQGDPFADGGGADGSFDNDGSGLSGDVADPGDGDAAGDSGDSGSGSGNGGTPIAVVPTPGAEGAPSTLSCEPSGPVVADHWGSAPGGGSLLGCVVIRNDGSGRRVNEVAYSSVPIARDAGLTTTTGLALVGAGGTLVPAQFDVRSRWASHVDDATAPIRWLEVSVPATLEAGEQATYAIQQYATLDRPVDATAVAVNAAGNLHTISTGVASFELDASLPGLLRRIDALADSTDPDDGLVYQYAGEDGMGPRLELGGQVVGNIAGASGSAVVDAGGFEIVQSGPIRVVVAQRGHFVSSTGLSLCAPRDSSGQSTGLNYEALGYTLVLSFSRGHRHIDAQFNFRNECSDLTGGPPWTNDGVTVDKVSFVIPLTLGQDVIPSYAGSGVPLAGSGAYRVVQKLGGGNPWRRRAEVVQAGVAIETATQHLAPYVGSRGATVAAGLTMPWMRFREPQALAVAGGVLSAELVAEPMLVGEARGIWGQFRLSLSSSTTEFEGMRNDALAAMERGLLVRPTLGMLNLARVFPAFSDNTLSPLALTYADHLNHFHSLTISEQWEASKIYGSQLWPDIPFNPAVVATPSNHSIEMNYWNASRTELFEYLRSGDPKWVWDWALPQSWYQFFSAYLNAGEQAHGDRNGVAGTSGGSGWEDDIQCGDNNPSSPSPECGAQSSYGHWGRSKQGSDDYTYTHGDLAYLVRPHYALLRRFAATGAMLIRRYPDDENLRGQFVSERVVARQVVQHLALLANCAEFVPGDEGRQCHEHLISILQEFSRDNFAAGVMCQRDDRLRDYDPSSQLLSVANPQTCVVPQQFMQNALMLPLFLRLYMNYGDVGGALERMLQESIWNYYRFGMGLPLQQRPASIADPARPAILTDPAAPWTNQLQYRLSPSGDSVESCNEAPVGQPVAYDTLSGGTQSCTLNALTDPIDVGEESMILQNRPQTVGWMLVAHTLRPELRLCTVARNALADAGFLDLLNGYRDGTETGWLKGPAQVSQGLVFALAAFETCTEPGAD